MNLYWTFLVSAPVCSFRGLGAELPLQGSHSSLANASPLSLLRYVITSILLCMFGKLRQLETELELYDVALRALMRRAHSVHEMKRKLERRSDNKLLVQLVMARLKENGLIDDERYAKQFARQRTESRKQGKFRVARDLRARGVPDRHILTALEEATNGTDEGAVVRKRIERKLRSYRGEIDEKKMASIYGGLLRAGFSADVVRQELKAVTQEEVPDAEVE
jgi:SOS response regulatory protein OraA/RecX